MVRLSLGLSLSVGNGMLSNLYAAVQLCQLIPTSKAAVIVWRVGRSSAGELG